MFHTGKPSAQANGGDNDKGSQRAATEPSSAGELGLRTPRAEQEGDEDDGDDGDDDGDGHTADSSGNAVVSSAGSAVSGGVIAVDDSESTVQLLADSEDEAHSSEFDESDSDGDDEDDARSKLSEAEQKRRARRAQQRRRTLMEARLQRDAKRFSGFLQELTVTASAAVVQDVEELPAGDSSNNSLIRLTLNYFVEPPKPSSGSDSGDGSAFVPLFFCPASKASLPTIVGQFLKSRYELPIVADLRCPELFPAISHVHHAALKSPVRFYGSVTERIISAKPKQFKAACAQHQNGNAKAAAQKGKEKPEENDKETSDEKAGEGSAPTLNTAAQPKHRSASSDSTCSADTVCPRMFVFASDIALNSIVANYGGSPQIFYSHLYKLLSCFCARFGVTHIFFLHCMAMPVNVNLGKSMDGTDLTKRQLQKIIQQATEVDGEGAEADTDAEPLADAETVTVTAATSSGADRSEGHRGTEGGGGAVTSAAEDSKDGKQTGGSVLSLPTAGEEEKKSESSGAIPKTTSKASPNRHHDGSSKDKKRSSAGRHPSRGAHTAIGNRSDAGADGEDGEDGEDGAPVQSDPEEKREDEAQRNFEKRILSSFLYLTNAPRDALALNKLGGRLLSHAILAGPVSVFLNGAHNSASADTLSGAVAGGSSAASGGRGGGLSGSGSGNGRRSLSVVLLSAYYNPLLSNVRAVFKLVSTINKLAQQLRVEPRAGHCAGECVAHEPHREIRLREFVLDVISLRQRAGKIANKIRKALMKSISETAGENKPSSMYL